MGTLINITTPLLLGFLVGFLLILGGFFVGTTQRHKRGFKQKFEEDKILSSRVDELPREPEDPLQ